MGFAKGFRWDEKAVKRLRELVLDGHTVNQMTDILSKEYNRKFSDKSIEKAKFDQRLTSKYLRLDSGIKTYKCLNLKMDDYMVSCDYHSPYISEAWINRFLFISNHFKIKKNIIIGDLFDFDFARARFFVGGERSLDKEAMQTDPVIKALDYFDENILVTGNHERRIGTLTADLIQARHLFGFYGAEIWKKKFKYSIYDKLYIGKEWMLVHPKSYRINQTSVARALAEKYHRNVINTHGHFVGWAYDKSGQFECYDLGGMFDRKKIAYINLHTTTHPMWNNGFGMLKNGKFWHFTDASDWDYWLGQ